MEHAPPPLGLKLLTMAGATELFADAYAEAARSGAAMRDMAEALETLREALAGLDAMEAWRVARDQLGASFDTPRETVMTAMMVRVERDLLDALGALAGEARWRGFCVLMAHWRLRLLQMAVERWKAAPSPELALLDQVAGLCRGRAWPLLHDPLLDLVRPLESGPLKARLELFAAQVQLFHFRRFGVARASLERLREESPHDPWIVGNLGNWWDLRGDQERAKALFMEEITMAPARPNGYVRLGKVLSAAGDAAGAEAQFSQAAAVSPGSTDAPMALISLYASQKQYEYRADTIKSLRSKIRRLAPDEAADSLDEEAVGHRSNGRWDAARAALAEARRIEPDRTDLVVGQGFLSAMEAQALAADDARRAPLLEDAAKRFNDAVGRESRQRYALYGESFVAELRGQYDEALALNRNSLSCHPDWELAVVLREAELRRQATQFGQAREALDRALVLDPGNPDATWYLLSLGDDLMEKATDLAGAADAYRAAEGAYQAADAVYQSADPAWHAPRRGTVHNRMGNLFYRQREYDKAAQEYRAAIREAPDDPVLRSNLAGALMLLPRGPNSGDDLEEAIKALREAKRLDSANNRYTELMVTAIADLELIRRYGGAALTLSPTFPRLSMQLEPALLPVILNPGSVTLKPLVNTATSDTRDRLWERFGLVLPAVTYSDINAPGVPRGLLRAVLDGVFQIGEGQIDPGAPDVITRLLQGLEEAVISRPAALLTVDTLVASLNRLATPPSRAVAASPYLTSRLLRRLEEAEKAGCLSKVSLESAIREVQDTADMAAGPPAPDAGGTEPEFAPPPTLRTGGALMSGSNEWARVVVPAVQYALFNDTGAILPLVAIEADESLAPLDWAVRVGERTDTGTAAPADGDAAAGLTAPLIAALRPAAPLFVSRQIVRHLLDQTKKSHPAVVKAARALVGEAQIAAAMVMELREGRSVRNLPMLLEDLVRRNSDQR